MTLGSESDSFKDRATVPGPALNFYFKPGNLPVCGNAKNLQEPNVKDHVQGHAVLMLTAGLSTPAMTRTG